MQIINLQLSITIPPEYVLISKVEYEKLNRPVSVEVLTVPQLAKRLKMSERRVYEMKRQMDFPFYNFGERQIRVIWEEVLEWMKREKTDH